MRAGMTALCVVVCGLLSGGAQAAGGADIAGDYRCTSGCRLTDAAPSIAIDGRIATCMNELGGIYTGRVLSKTSVACLNKTGTLSLDGKTVRWSDGVVWERLERAGTRSSP